MGAELTQEEIDVLEDWKGDKKLGLKHLVAIGRKVYCWDEVRRACVAVKLEVLPDEAVPEKAERLIAKKRFNLMERISISEAVDACHL